MKKGKYTEEQIIGFLGHTEAGMPVKELELLAEAHSDLHALTSVFWKESGLKVRDSLVAEH